MPTYVLTWVQNYLQFFIAQFNTLQPINTKSNMIGRSQGRKCPKRSFYAAT